MRRHIWWLAPLAGAAVAGAVVAAVSLGGGSSSHGSPQTSHARLRPAAAALAFQQAITAVVHELSPSVVQIQNSQGLGSGIVFDTNGDIVTNNHVVAGGGPYTVTAGTHSYGASLVGRFAPDDLAILHVSGAKLAPAAFADSSRLEVGDFAIAIGNPLGLRSSVTEGIVSAFRQGVSEGNGVALPLMIQTSAAINPGNSGGALADLQGRVIGIPTLAATDPGARRRRGSRDRLRDPEQPRRGHRDPDHPLRPRHQLAPRLPRRRDRRHERPGRPRPERHPGRAGREGRARHRRPDHGGQRQLGRRPSTTSRASVSELKPGRRSRSPSPRRAERTRRST